MKVDQKKLSILSGCIAITITAALCVATALTHNDYTYSKKEMNEASLLDDEAEQNTTTSNIVIVSKLVETVKDIINDKKEADELAYRKSLEVYDGLTMDELTDKLNRNLKSTLSGTGNIFAEYSIELGLDPYLTVSIVLLETGCNYGCSQLVKQCNNVGGVKGSPGCNGGSYKSYPSLEAGIKGYMKNLYDNYYSKGLTTPEEINPKYAESRTWASKVNKYIKQIKAS